MNLLKDALKLLKAGKPVFPVDRASKHPLVKWKLFQDRLPLEDELKAKWGPASNIGMATGHLSGLVVIDCDSEEAANHFVDKYSEAVNTLQVKTGRGRHFYFHFEGGVRNDAGSLLGAGIDVRGEGGFVILPPSIHATGKAYRWLNNKPISLPARLKEILVSRIRTGSPDGSVAEGLHERFNTAQALSGVPEGQRDEMVFNLVRTLHYARVPQDWAKRLILEAARNCQPPFPDSVALEKVDRAFARYKPGENLTSDYRDPPSEVRLGREVNLATLQADAKNSEKPPLSFLPVLGQERFIVSGWSHLIAGYPKAGKTELVVRIIAEWSEERILYVTEEPESVWDARMQELPENYGHVTLYFGLGVKPAEILDRVGGGDETVVIIDTVRNLLGLRDETDNSEVARAMNPYISSARQGNKTLIMLHHNRKGGGEHGEGITGGHAFMGVVDLALEIKFDGPDDSRRRQLRGWGRVIEVPKLLYELQDDNTMIALGSPAQVALGEVKERVRGELSDEWVQKKAIREALDDPKPSDDQVGKALNALGADGKAERNPPLSEGQRPGVRYKWRLAQNLTSDEPSYRSEVRLGPEDDPKVARCQIGETDSGQSEVGNLWTREY